MGMSIKRVTSMSMEMSTSIDMSTDRGCMDLSMSMNVGYWHGPHRTELIA